jgi:hypothetical protein
MRIAFGEAGIFGGIETRIHAGKDGETPRRRHRQLRFGAETRGVGFIGLQDFRQNRHQ